METRRVVMLAAATALLLFAAAGAVLLTASCTGEHEPAGLMSKAPAGGSEPEPAEPVSQKTLVDLSNDFAWELFREVLSAENDVDANVFISPLSASYALTMTSNGARGETYRAMAEALGQSELSLEGVNQAYLDLTRHLLNCDPNLTCAIANSIWYRDNLAVHPGFVERGRTYFDADVIPTGFSDPDGVDSINTWCEEHTNGRITDIVTPPISDNTIMILLNAIYFNADWTVAFDEENTSEGWFDLAGGGKISHEMMSRQDTLKFFVNDLALGADIPYGNGSYSLTLLMPNRDKTLGDLVTALNSSTWDDWQGSFVESDELLTVPKLQFAYKTGLTDALEDMGMGIALHPGADFSGLFDPDQVSIAGPTYINDVKQKTFLKMDETGTEAAAVTSVSIVTTISGPQFAFTRPFVMVIHEHETGAILFVGKIGRPEWSEE